MLNSDKCILNGTEIYLCRCFLIKLRKFRKQVFKVLLLLVAIMLEDHDTSASLFIYGGDGSWVDQAIFWPVRTTRVPNLPLWNKRRWSWICFMHKQRGSDAILTTKPNIWTFVFWHCICTYPIFQLCIGSLPTLVLLTVFAFFSRLSFLWSLWHFFPF